MVVSGCLVIRKTGKVQVQTGMGKASNLLLSELRCILY